MSATLDGYCFIGFPLPKELLIGVTSREFQCPQHGVLGLGHLFCPLCGTKRQEFLEEAWTLLAQRLATRWGLQLSKYCDVYVFEDYYCKGHLGRALKAAPNKVSPPSYDQADYAYTLPEVLAVVKEVQELAAFVYPEKPPEVGFLWGYSLS